MTSEPVATASAELLAEPLDLGKHVMRNRIAQAPLSVCYADPSGAVTAATVGHYARRSAGGAGMVITENFAVSHAGRQFQRQGLIAGVEFLDGLRELAAAIKANGALAVIQIVHAGRYAGPWEQYDAARRLAPSAVEFQLTATRVVTPAEATVAELDQVRQEFVRAALLAREAGFDGVELHGAQGFLLSSFQSPRMNHRSDEHGGGLDGRTLLTREVVQDVVTAVGDDLLVGFHLMSDEMMPGGWTRAEAAQLAESLEGLGVDFIAPIPTTFESLRAQREISPSSDPTIYDPGVFGLIRAATNLPLFANGGLGEPTAARAVLESGLADVVMLGRPLLTDPDWSRKVLDDRAASIVACSCNPPTCLATQMTGAVCHAWSESDRARGFIGL